MITIATGVGGSNLKNQAPTEPATAPAVLSFGMIIASYTIPWACLASDFTTYFSPQVSSWRIFTYAYLGLVIPTVLLMTLGAAIGGAVPIVEGWQDASDAMGAGGVLALMLEPVGRFGQFVVVVLAFSLLGNISGTMYSVTLNFQILLPWLVRVPRYVFSIIVTAIIIPVSIRAAVDFFVNLENFVSIIGYWTASFVGIVVTEHILFKKGDPNRYDHDAWNDAKLLPTGVAAIAAAVLCFGLVIPWYAISPLLRTGKEITDLQFFSMEQVWWVGPIAKHTGDIGFEMAFILSAILYAIFRKIEIHFWKR